MSPLTKKRLDQWLVERGDYPSRARARDAIGRGTVFIDGTAETRPGRAISEHADVVINDPAQTYVSRAALKLKHGLETFSFSPAGLHCLDIGASTGGFTQVLLEHGAAHVSAIDVGHDQLAASLRDHPAVTNLEGLNARALTRQHINQPLEFIVCDASFISLKLVLAAALDLAANGALLLALIKPQFEAGKQAIGKGGIVRDAAVHAAICDGIQDWLANVQHWSVIGLITSPVAGSDGNREFIIAARKA